MNHRRVLENMRTLIDHGWTQGCGARNAGNVRVEITAPDACRWCLVGAAHLATLAEPDATDNDHCGVCGVRCPIVRLLRQIGGFPVMVAWNDAPARQKSDVIELLDKAIAYVDQHGSVEAAIQELRPNG
jgi:hypothetical protein